MKINIDRTTPIDSFLASLRKGVGLQVIDSAKSPLVTVLDTDEILLPNYLNVGEDYITIADVWMRMGAANHVPLDIFCLRALWENSRKLEERFRARPNHPNDAICLQCDGTILSYGDNRPEISTAFMRFNPGSGKFYLGDFYMKHHRGTLTRSLVVQS